MKAQSGLPLFFRRVTIGIVGPGNTSFKFGVLVLVAGYVWLLITSATVALYLLVGVIIMFAIMSIIDFFIEERWKTK